MQHIFGNSLHISTDEEIEAVNGKIILTPKNEDGLQLNNNFLNLMKERENTFYASADSIAENNIENKANYSLECLHTYTN